MEEVIQPQIGKDYQMPTTVFFGRGIFKKIATFPEIKTAKRILLVTGQHFKKTKDFQLLEEVFNQEKREVLVYKEEINKSSFEAVNRLSGYCSKIGPEIIIAVGGGTILDTAKCAAILAKSGGKAEDYLITKTRQLKNKGISFIAVPTTAGTGSEVTPWAVVWDLINKKKYSLASPFMFPKLAIVDPSLTDDLPSRITAQTGMDALTQAIEAYWSKSNNPVSDKYALEAINLIIENITQAVNYSNPKVRDMMAKGSLLAGLAFSNTKTTICHSVSYPMTAHFNVVHGEAVAITLPLFIKYSFSSLETDRKKKLLKVVLAHNEEQAAKKFTALLKRIDLATRLSQLGIKRKDIELIVKEGFDPDRANNAPRIPRPEELRKMLEEIL